MGMDPKPSRLQGMAPVRSPDEGGHGKGRRKGAGRPRLMATAAAAALALVIGLASVTYSYITASSEVVVNTFAGGAISLTLDEAKTDTDGTPADDGARVQENSYKIVPGATLYKDPTVTVLEGSEPCYVFLYVEDPLDEEYFTVDYSGSWTLIASDGAASVYAYECIVDASDGNAVLTPIFTTVTVSGSLTSDQIEAMGEFQMKLQAYAVQSEGVDEDTAAQMAVSYFGLGTGTEADDETEADAETETETDAETDADVETETETGAETEADVETEADETEDDDDDSVSLTITGPETGSPGDELTYTASADGADCAVTWGITGGTDSVITSDGVLTIGGDETADSIQVIASLSDDPYVYAVLTVQIEHDDATEETETEAGTGSEDTDAEQASEEDASSDETADDGAAEDAG